MRETITKAVSFNNCKIIGLVTQLEDYHLAYFLNKVLKINFIKCEDIVLEEDRFSYFYYNSGERDLVYSLVSLKYKSIPWSPTFVYYDYFLIIRQSVNETIIKTIIDSIFNIKGVFSAEQIDNKLDSETIISSNAKRENTVRIYNIKETSNEYQDLIDCIDEHEEYIRQSWLHDSNKSKSF